MNLIQSLEQEQVKKEIVKFSPGDTVRVHVKVVEGGRERIKISSKGSAIMNDIIRIADPQFEAELPMVEYGHSV